MAEKLLTWNEAIANPG